MLRVERRVPASRGTGLILMALLSACSGSSSEPEPGVYRAVIEAPEGEIPFGLELGPAETGGDSQAPSLFLLDGDKRIAFDRVVRVEMAFEARLPGGKGALDFTARGAKLSGYAHLPNRAGSTDEFLFTAESGAAYRFFREPATDNVDVAGRWSASFSSSSDDADWVIALTQSHDQVTGTFHGPDGVEQAVTGQVQGDDVRLSSFDGHAARLFTATVNEDGVLEGDAWSNLTGSARWIAKRNPDAEIDAAASEDSPTPL